MTLKSLAQFKKHHLLNNQSNDSTVDDNFESLCQQEAPNSQYSWTTEQQQIHKEFLKGGSFKVIAFAGSGKTTLLKHLFTTPSPVPIYYLAFNRSIVDEFKKSSPVNKSKNMIYTINQYCLTVLKNHNSPWSNGLKYSAKLTDNLTADQIKIDVSEETKIVFSHLFNLFCLDSNLCFDQFIRQYIYKLPENLLNQIKINNTFFNSLSSLFNILNNPNDLRIPITLEYTVKLVSQNPPLNKATWIIDEAQDLNINMLKIIQNHMLQDNQVILVGDPYQSIYAFRKAANILNHLDIPTFFMTQTFRFGSQIAQLCNTIIHKFDTQKSIQSSKTDHIQGKDINLPNGFYIFRTNISLIKFLLNNFKNYTNLRIPFDLQINFEYLRNINQLTANTVIALTLNKQLDFYQQLHQMLDDYQISYKEFETLLARHTITTFDTHQYCLLTTVHKSKGLEADNVIIYHDFPAFDILQDQSSQPITDLQYIEELNILYVAFSRAKANLYLPETAISLYESNTSIF